MSAPTSHATGGPASATARRVAPCEPAWEVDATGELFSEAGESCARPSPVAEPSAPPASVSASETASLPDPAPPPVSSARQEGSPESRPAQMTTAAAERLARGVLVTVLEVVDGRRAPATVSALLDAGPMMQVTRLAKAPRRPADAAQVRTVQVSLSPTKKAHTSGIEVCATYARGRRLFAVAARLEAGGGRVRCTGLRMPC